MKPIIFSTPMIRAILDGTKTQTRRPMKPQPTIYDGLIIWKRTPDRLAWHAWLADESPEHALKHAPHKPGDALYVRETFTAYDDTDTGEIRYIYKSASMFKDCEPCDITWDWSPSIHMPREAARVFLKVTNVRVERLQDITEEDARAEGVCKDSYFDFPSYKTGFCKLWNSIYKKRNDGKYSWDENPFVWVYEFERAEADNE